MNAQTCCCYGFWENRIISPLFFTSLTLELHIRWYKQMVGNTRGTTVLVRPGFALPSCEKYMLSSQWKDILCGFWESLIEFVFIYMGQINKKCLEGPYIGDSLTWNWSNSYSDMKSEIVDCRFDIQLSAYVPVPPLSVNACAHVCFAITRVWEPFALIYFV